MRTRIIWYIAGLCVLWSCGEQSAPHPTEPDSERVLGDAGGRAMDLDSSLAIIDAMSIPDALPFDLGPDAFVGDCRVNSDCDDGLFCNGLETCSENRCYASPINPCDDGVRCTREGCNEEERTCTNEPDEALCPPNHLCDLKLGCFPIVPCQLDSDCDDGSACNGIESCFMDRCAPGRPTVCDDDVLCTVDVCIDETGDCEFLPVHARCIETQLCSTEEGCVERPPCERNDDCDDGSFCNGTETCDEDTGACRPGIPPEVDDGVPCTIDVCSDRLAMVVHTPTPARCSDGSFCNGAEVCHPVMGCQPGTPPALSDGIGCTEDTCNEDLDFIEHRPRDATCDDGLFCNGPEVCHPLDGCVIGEPPVVNDGVGCTIDACSEVEARVIHQPNDDQCDDGLFCNGAEFCDAILDCQNGMAPSVEDAHACTVDECDELNDEIIHRPDNSICDDGLFCNGAEACDVARGCLAGEPPRLNDEIPCTVDTCDEETDRIIHQADDQTCDDGNLCNGAEICVPGDGCRAGAPLNCNDGNICNGTEVCVPDRGCQQGVPLNCDDGQFCNGQEICLPDRGCTARPLPDLDDGIACTLDSCDEETDSIQHTPRDMACDDGLFCNGAERCDAQIGCRMGDPPNLDDDIPCTQDSCDEVRDEIIHSPVDALCDSGATMCAGSDYCDPNEGCLQRPPMRDGDVCNDNPRNICLNERCQVSACGDGFVDLEAGEECDDGGVMNGDGCDENCMREGEPGPGGMGGTYTLVSGDDAPLRFRFGCGLFGVDLVSSTITSFGFIERDNRLEVSVQPGPVPRTMRQSPMPNGLNFSVDSVIDGGCREEYSLTGRFDDDTYRRWSGTLRFCFVGAQCDFTTCTGCENFQVNGLRVIGE